ncbi:MAG: trigger factor [Planctomycetota bacterium]
MSENPSIRVESAELEPCLQKISVQVPAERVSRELERAFRSLTKKVRLPGFRPGKIPFKVLQKRFGESLEKDAREAVLERLVGEALQAKNLFPLRGVQLDADSLEVSEGVPLTFEFEVETAPPVELPPWEEVPIEARDTEPTLDQIDAAFKALTQDHPRFDSEEKAGVDGEHLAECDLLFLKEGEEGPRAEGVRLGPESPLYGTDPEAFGKALSGCRTGDAFRLSVEFKEGFSRKEWIGESGEVEVKVTRVVRPRPATREELASDLGFESEDALKEAVLKRLRKENEGNERDRQALALLEGAGRLRPFPLPPRLLEEEIEATVKAHAERLEKEGGLSPEEAAARAEGEREAIVEASRKRLQNFFLIRKTAAEEKIRVTEGDLRQAYQVLASRHGTEDQAVRAYYRENGLERGLQNDILEGKVRARLAQIAAGQAEARAVVVPTEEQE